MSLGRALKQLLFMSSPMILGQVGQTLIGAGDVLVASRYSTHTVAAIGVANGIFTPFLVLGIGLMMGISPLLANKIGSGVQTKGYLKSMVAYALVIGFILSLLVLILNNFIHLFGIEDSLVLSIKTYIKIIAFTIPLSLVFQAVKEYLQATEDVLIPNLLSLAAVFVNIGLNFLFVYGYGGFSGLGEIGLPLASIVVRSFLLIGILAYALPKETWGKLSWPLNREIFIFSFPVAIAFFFEVLAFCMVSVLSGKLGIISAAANNIILTMGSALFMVPLSIASAASVKVGNAYGRNDEAAVKIFIKASLVIAVFYSLFSSGFLVLMPKYLMKVFTSDTQVILLGVQACYVAALFQLLDCAQVSLSGLLRGLKETKIPSMIMFVAFWIVGIPLGIYLAFYESFDIVGLWLGLAAGLAVSAVSLTLLLKIHLKKIF